jgi:capsular polysaccharide biosynthesis protein
MSEENLDFTSFFSIVFKRLWITILITLIAVSTSAYVSFYVLTPIYQAKVQLLVSGQHDPEDPNLNASADEALKLKTTYQDIIQSPLILQGAQLKLDEEGQNIKIGGSISVNQKTESQVLELLVEHKNPKAAQQIANAVAESFSEQIPGIMGIEESNVKVLSKATVNPVPVSPKPVLIIGITFVVALIVSIWINILIHFISKNRKTSKSRRSEKS